MAKLKAENVSKCVSILKEFIAGSSSADKQQAILALEQLHNITAGSFAGDPGCIGKPRANSLEAVPGYCISRPRIEGTETEMGWCQSRPRADG